LGVKNIRRIKMYTNSLLYKYFDRDYVGENEEWAVYSEVLIENIHEFLNHLTTIDKKMKN